MISVLGPRAQQAPSTIGIVARKGEGELSDVAEAARRAAPRVTQGLGVTVSTAGAEGAPLVGGAPSQVAARLRSLMVELVVGQRVRWRGVADQGGVLELHTAPAADMSGALRVIATFGGASRELRLPIAGAVALPEHGFTFEGAFAS